MLAATARHRRATRSRQPPAPGTAKDFVIPAPKRFTLANGLPVTLVPFGQVPKVTIRLVVQAANLHEGRRKSGSPDLTGDMMSEGTTALTADALAREFASMGGELGVGVGPDTASISTEVLSDHGVKAVQLVADVATRPLLRRRSSIASRQTCCVTSRFARARHKPLRRRSSPS